MNARERGCCFEIVWGRQRRAQLDAEGWITVDGQTVKRTYIYGSALNLAHVSLSMGNCQRDTLCELSSDVLRDPTHISRIMGMDGVELFLDANGTPTYVAQIDEVKTTKSRNALFGTYMLSENLLYKAIRQRFAIVHPSEVRIVQEPLRRMREIHGHDVEEILFNPPNEDIEEVHRELFPPRESAPPESTAETDDRHWQVEQMKVLTPILQNIAKNVGASGTVLRLDAYMSAGKSRAIAKIMKLAPKAFQMRVVSASTVPGLKHLLRVLQNVGVPVEECDYTTSHGHDGTSESSPELSNTGKIKIQRMMKAHVDHLSDPDAARPAVLGCLHHTLPELYDIVEKEQLLDVSTRMLYVQDEAQEFRSFGVMDNLVDNPYIVTIQVSGTFHDMDMELIENHPRWCVQPYYKYTYAASIRDGYSVPLDVYLFASNDDSTRGRSEKLFDILCLYPGTTIVTTRTKYEADEMCKSILDKKLGYSLVSCVHSKMKRIDNKAKTPEEVIGWVNANPSKAAVIITVRMARNSINIPSAVNFVDFASSALTIDHLRQSQGRIIRAFSMNEHEKHAARYFVKDSDSMRDLVHYSKELFDERNITIYNMHGVTLDAMIHHSIHMRPRASMPPEEMRSKQKREYRFAFPALAYEANQQIVTTKQKQALLHGTRWIKVPFLSGSVTADLRCVVDDIVRVYNGKSAVLSLPDEFVYPEYAVNARKGRANKNVNIAKVKITAEQLGKLKDKPITDDVWNEIERSCGGIHKFKEVKDLWKSGCMHFKEETLHVPMFKECDMSVDVNELCKTELHDVYRDGVLFCERDYIRWILMRLKLAQLKLLEHPEYEDLANEENARIKRRQDAEDEKRRAAEDKKRQRSANSTKKITKQAGIDVAGVS